MGACCRESATPLPFCLAKGRGMLMHAVRCACHPTFMCTTLGCPDRCSRIWTSLRTSSTSSAVTSFRFDIDLHASCSPVFLSFTRCTTPKLPLPSTLSNSYTSRTA